MEELDLTLLKIGEPAFAGKESSLSGESLEGLNVTLCIPDPNIQETGSLAHELLTRTSISGCSVPPLEGIVKTEIGRDSEIKFQEEYSKQIVSCSKIAPADLEQACVDVFRNIYEGKDPSPNIKLLESGLGGNNVKLANIFAALSKEIKLSENVVKYFEAQVMTLGNKIQGSSGESTQLLSWYISRAAEVIESQAALGDKILNLDTLEVVGKLLVCKGLRGDVKLRLTKLLRQQLRLGVKCREIIAASIDELERLLQDKDEIDARRWELESLLAVLHKTNDSADGISVASKVKMPAGNFEIADQDIPMESPPIPVLEKSTQKLFEELYDLNRGNDYVIELLKNLHDTSMLEQIGDKGKDHSKLHPHGTVEEWTLGDVTEWRKHLTKDWIKENLAEVFAVMKRVSFLSHGYVPRTIQIIAAYILYKSNISILAEISTGEGKTLVFAMTGSLKALEGYWVGITTSNSVLARQNLLDQYRFYAALGLTVGENTGGWSTKDCYKKNIVYGDSTSYIGDHLRGWRGSRDFENAYSIVDEVDSPYIDQTSHLVMLQNALPYSEYLRVILRGIWAHLLDIIYVEGDVFVDPTKNKLISYINALLEGTDSISPVPIPNHLKSFVKHQARYWASSAIQAFQMQENVHYVLTSADGAGKIAVLDRHTGVTQTTMRWGQGLYQFLQMKHGLKVSSESLVSIFMSNVEFFKKYMDRVIGGTGSLGSEAEVKMLTAVYGAKVIYIPTCKEKQVEEIPGFLAASEIEWFENIIEAAIKETKKGRAVLVLVMTIRDVDKIEEKLIMAGFQKDKIKRYSRSDTTENSVVNQKMAAGEVLISTNLCGRGMDLKTTEDVDRNGGLANIFGTIFANKREKDQGVGRTGRQGKKGTWQFIVDRERGVEELSQLYPEFYGDKDTLEGLIEWRDLVEKERLLRDEVYRIDMITMQDALFRRFTNFTKYFEKKHSKSSYFLNQVTEHWSFWLNEQRINDRFIPEKLKKKDAPSIRQETAKLRSRLIAGFENFTNGIEERYQNGTLITNVKYHVEKCRSIRSISCFDDAIAQEGFFAVAAYYERGRLAVENSNKIMAIESLQNTKRNIEDKLVPLLQAELFIINRGNITSNDPDLIQITSKVEIFQELARYIDRAIGVIKASISNDWQKIRFIGVSFTEVFQDDFKKYQEELSDLQDIGIPNFYNVETFGKKKKKSWWGSVIAFVAGIVQVGIGALISVGSAGFAAKWGIDMIVKGVTDISKSVISFITKRAIDLKNYLKQTAIGYAVSILSMGVANLIDKAKTAVGFGQKVAQQATNEATKKAAEEAVGMTVKQVSEAAGLGLMKNTAIQVVGASLGAVLGDKLIDDRRQRIEKKVGEQLAKMLETHREDINKIIASDTWKQVTDVQTKLWRSAYDILNEKSYRQEYENMGRTIAKGVLSSTHVLVDIALKAFDINKSLNSISTITKRFCATFGPKIRELGESRFVLTSENMMLQALTYETHLDNKDAEGLIKNLTQTAMIQYHALNCTQCEKVELFDDKYRKTISSSCARVCRIVQADNSIGIASHLRDLIDEITNIIMERSQNEIIDPVAGTTASLAINEFFEAMERLRLEEVKKQREEARRQKEDKRQDSATPSPLPGQQNQNQDQKNNAAAERTKRLLEINSEIIDYPEAGQYTDQNNEPRKLALLHWIDHIKQETGITNREAFDSVWSKLLEPENNLPLIGHQVVAPLFVGIAEGIKVCMSTPACSATAVTLIVATGQVLGKITKEAYEDYLLNKKLPSDILDKPKPRTKDQAGATPPPPHFPGDDEGPPDDRERFKWEVKDPKDASKIGRDPEFGNIYKDPTQKVGNKEIWWSKERGTYGHGGSRYKLFVERSNHFEHIADIDESGWQVLKHKSDTGMHIYKDLIIWRK